MASRVSAPTPRPKRQVGQAVQLAVLERSLDQPPPADTGRTADDDGTAVGGQHLGQADQFLFAIDQLGARGTVAIVLLFDLGGSRSGGHGDELGHGQGAQEVLRALLDLLGLHQAHGHGHGERVPGAGGDHEAGHVGRAL